MYRVTQRSMFSTFNYQLNTNLSEYMDLSLQSATMKKVNAPSDAPASAAHILNYRSSIAETNQFMSNVDTALGWLNLSDGVLSEVNTTLTRFRELAEQAATGTMNDENREQIAHEANQLFMQMINLSNSEFNDRFIFAGQNIDKPPYELGIGVTSKDPELEGIHFTANGSIENSTMIRFETDPPDRVLTDAEKAGFTLPPQTGKIKVNYSYSNDGGETWTTKTLDPNDTALDIGTAQVEIPVMPTTVIKPYNPDEPFSEENGTSFVVRPAAMYKGYDDSVLPDVTTYGELDATVTPQVNALLPKGVQVRIDSPVDFTKTPQAVDYSYSTDNGQTWITKSVDTLVPQDGSADAMLRLPIPGGYFDLNSNVAAAGDPSGIAEGTQFTLKPHQANIDYESAQESYVTVNSIGKDLFGGLYTPQGTNIEVSAFDGAPENLFETLGAFIGALETNDQDACGQALENIKSATKNLLIEEADIGGRINRLEATKEMLENSKLDKTERVSLLEDVDITELINKLTMQQMTYQTVLQSSSMVMKLNLTNFL